MRPLSDGTSGFVGFAGRGYPFKVCYNEEGSDPENLGNDIVDFIVSHTAQELEELKDIVDELEWVIADSVERMTTADRL